MIFKAPRRHLVQRVFDEELSSQAEKNRVQVAEIVRQFQCRPGDTGSTPVQSQWFTLT